MRIDNTTEHSIFNGCNVVQRSRGDQVMKELGQFVIGLKNLYRRHCQPLTAASLVLICVVPSYSQFRSTQWTADSGLPQNIIRGVAETPDGYLWIATLNGVARFDGVRFTVFNRSNTPG